MVPRAYLILPSQDDKGYNTTNGSNTQVYYYKSMLTMERKLGMGTRKRWTDNDDNLGLGLITEDWWSSTLNWLTRVMLTIYRSPGTVET